MRSYPLDLIQVIKDGRVSGGGPNLSPSEEKLFPIENILTRKSHCKQSEFLQMKSDRYRVMTYILQVITLHRYIFNGTLME